MLSKRIVAVSQDQKFQKRLTAGLMAAGGAVETVSADADLTPKRLEADLYVYHYADPETLEFGNLLAKLKPETPLIVLLPQPDLGKCVDIMRDSRINNVLVADELEVSRLSATATKILYGDVFGLEKFLPWGVRIYSMLIGDYQEKSLAIAAISEFATAMGVRRKYRESIEQNLDELLMNALYDAPVDESGKKVFAEIPTKTRITMRMDQKAVVQYACDGDRFAVSVRDSYGVLTKDIVLKFIDKALRSAHQIDRKEGGAGLGLYMVANSSSEFIANIYPGVATEVVCVFDLNAPKLQNKNFGVHIERLDVAGRMVSTGGRARPMRGGRAQPQVSPMLKLGLVATLLLFLGSAGFALFQTLRPAPKGMLAITTEPPGAFVFLDNVNMGKTPMAPLSLDTGTYALKVELEGYQTSGPDPVRVAPSKEPTQLTVRLARQKGTVVINSTPSGARVFVNGQETGKITPTSIETLSGDQLTVSVRQPGYAEATQKVAAPAAGQVASIQLPMQLAPGYALLSATSEPPGAVVLLNDVEQTPSGEAFVLKAGTYELTARLPGYVPFIQRIALRPGEKRSVHAKLVKGGLLSLRSNVEAKVYVDNRPVGKTPIVDLGLAEGMHLVALRSVKPFLSYEMKVMVRKNDKIERDLSFGTIAIAANNVVARSSASDGKDVTELALPVGTHKLSLINKSTGEKREREVTIVGGRTVPIDKW